MGKLKKLISSQLGLANCQNQNVPMKVPLPKLDSILLNINSLVNDEILKLEPGWKHTIILTKFGRVFVTEGVQEKKK